MKHFTKIEPGALKSQKPKVCQNCGNKINVEKDYFVLEAYWKIKRKADKHSFCSLKCLTAWARS